MDLDEQVEQSMAQFFLQSKAQFGSAVKSFWFYGSESCPGCRKKANLFKHKGKESISLNAFIYRKRGVLIGYILCGRCATAILRDANRNPGQETARHAAIELNLINAYLMYLSSLDS